MKNIFEYQKPTEESIKKIGLIRETCDAIHTIIINSIPESRERSISITKLEEVSMWANKAIVFNQVEE